MKFRCERDTLGEALSITSRTAGARGALPPSIRLSLSGNRLLLMGTDLDLTARVEIEVIGLDDGVCMAPARLTTDIVRNLDVGAVTVEASGEEVEISAARSRFVVQTVSNDEAVITQDLSPNQVFIPIREFSEGLNQVIRAASSDESRGYLNGILMTTEGDGVRLVATDSYRLALRDLRGVSALPGEMDQVIVPLRAMTEVQRLLSAAARSSTRPKGRKESDAGEERNAQDKNESSNTDTSTIGLSIGDFNATFTVGNVHLTTRLIEAKYPNYRQLIPDAYPNRLTVDRQLLIDALGRARLLSRDSTTPVRLMMKTGHVMVVISAPETGHASEDIDADFDGEEMSIAFNPTYLMEGVQAVTSDEVLLETLDSGKPATIRAPGDEEFKYLLMPVRS